MKLTDEELENVSGGMFKNVRGMCTFYKCKFCGQTGVDTLYGTILQDSSHQCVPGKSKDFTESTCETCVYNLGGPFCSKNGISRSI